MSAIPDSVVVGVTTPAAAYDIVIGPGLLGQASVWLDLPAAAHAVIVTNPTVGAHYARKLNAVLAGRWRQVSILELISKHWLKHIRIVNHFNW